MTALDNLIDRVYGHTEGPWMADGMDSGHSRYEMSRWVTAGTAADTICDMDGLTRSQNELVARNDGAADVELIAAAPKMLAALKEVEDTLVVWGEYYNDDDVASNMVFTMSRAIRRAIEDALA